MTGGGGGQQRRRVPDPTNVLCNTRTRGSNRTQTQSRLAILIDILLLFIVILARRPRLDAFTRRRLFLILCFPLPTRHRRSGRHTRRARTALRRRTTLLRWRRRCRLCTTLLTLCLLALNLRHLVGSQESATWSTRPAHRVVMSRLVEIGFPSLGCKTQCLFETLTRDATLEDTVELLRVDVQRALLCSPTCDKLGRLRVLRRLCGHWWRYRSRDVVDGLRWGAGGPELGAYAARVSELVCELVWRAWASRSVFLEVDAAHARRGIWETRIRRQERVSLARRRGSSCHGGGLCRDTAGYPVVHTLWLDAIWGLVVHLLVHWVALALRALLLRRQDGRRLAVQRVLLLLM